MKKFLFVVLAVIGIACLVACGSDTPKGNTIIGVWKNDEYNMDFIYTFNEDGTGNYNSAGTDMPFTYKTEGEKLSILYDGNTVSFDTEYKIENNTLNVLDSLGNDTLYKRVK